MKRLFSIVNLTLVIGLLATAVVMASNGSDSEPQKSHAPITSDTRATPDAHDVFTYVMSYQGLFSSFVPIDIADLEVSVSPSPLSLEHPNGDNLYQLQLVASTERYSKAEVLYPVRYRYQSFVTPELSLPLLIDEQTALSDPSRELVWFDWSSKQAQIFKQMDDDDYQKLAKLPEKQQRKHVQKQQQKLALLPEVVVRGFLQDSGQMSLRFDETNPMDLSQQTIEPLSMLFQIRRALIDQQLNEKSQLAFSVLVGDEYLDYQAHWVASEVITLDGEQHKAVHVQLRGRELTGDNPDEWGKSFSIWFSQEDSYIPLKLKNSVPLGVFKIELVSIAPLMEHRTRLSDHKSLFQDG